MRPESPSIEYQTGKEYEFFTKKYIVLGPRHTITEVVDNNKQAFKIFGVLPLNRRVKLKVTNVKKSGQLSLETNGKYLLDVEEKLKVIRIKENQDETKSFELKGSNGRLYYTRLLKWQYSKYYRVPSELNCIIYKRQEKTHVRQIIDELNKHPLFEKNQNYEFTFLKLETGVNGRRYISILGQDNIVYRVECQGAQEYSDLKRSKITCTLVDYDSSGELFLIQANKFFITLKKVFNADIDEKEFLLKLATDFASTPALEKFKVQYKENDNRWVLSLSNALMNFVSFDIKRCSYKKAIENIELFDKIERYVLQSSYLSLFSPEKRTDLTSTGNATIAYFQSLLVPLKVLSDLTYEDFIDKQLRDAIDLSIDQLNTLLILFRIAAPGYWNNEAKIFHWFNSMGREGCFSKDEEIQKGFFDWITDRCSVLEKDLMEKIFFNNNEKAKFYKGNVKLLHLINYYILLYNINRTDENKQNSKILLSKIIRGTVLYKNDKNDSGSLSKLCIAILRNRMEININFGWNYLMDIIGVESSFKEYKGSAPMDLSFLEAKGNKRFIKDTPVYGELISNSSLGYQARIDDFDAIVAKKTIDEYEAAFYYNYGNKFKPKFKLIATDEIGESVLYGLEKETTDYLNNLSDVVLKQGQIVKGLVQKHTVSGTVVDIGGRKGFVRKKEIDWSPVLYPQDFLSIGQVYDFIVLMPSINTPNATVRLSRKLGEKDPFISLKNHVGKIVKGRFIRHLTVEFLNTYYNLKIDLNAKETTIGPCPRCLHVRGFENENLVVDLIKKRWYCSDTDCGFQGEDILLFRIDALAVNTAVPTRHIQENLSSIVKQIQTGDILKLKIVYVERSIHFVTSQIAGDGQIQLGERINLSRENSVQDREVSLELAKVYDDIASIQKKVFEELNYLNFAQHFYGLAGHPKFYYYNIYISLLGILSELEKTLDRNYDGDIILKIKSLAIAFLDSYQDASRTLSHYSILENHISILRSLAEIGNIQHQFNHKLLESIYVDRPEVHAIYRKVSKLILSYNMLCEEVDDKVKFDREWSSRMYSVLKEGLVEIRDVRIDLSDQLFAQNQRRADEIMLLIHKGEGKKIEFKSSLYTPVLDKKRLAELDKFQAKLAQAKSEGNVVDEQNLNKAINAIRNGGPEAMLKFEAMKELAAFANSEGGCLLIGVDDEKNVIGLSHDFDKLSKADKQDAFKLRFDDIVKDYLGDSVFDLLTSDFVAIDDKLVFVVDVKPSNTKSDPVWMNKNDKGNVESLLFIRAESSARNLAGKDLANYIKRR